jgi:hypothetical protein
MEKGSNRMKKRLVTAALLAGCATVGLSPAFAADNTTTLSGKAFVDLTHVAEKGDGVKTDNTGTGLDVTRFYLGVDHTFNDIWSANLTTDFAYSSADNYNEV